jgi:secondary thiamine-phosphate synthase enzyme
MIVPKGVEWTVSEIRVRTSRRIEALDITVNENADPAVMKDIIDALDRLVPADHPYSHREGNSDAHIKSSLMGHSLTIPLSGNDLVLGTWQGIYLMEFDGPRERRIAVSVS